MGGSRLVIRYFCLVLLLLVTLIEVQAHPSQVIFNVLQFGGKADGVTDNSKVLSDLWNQSCQNVGGGVILFPVGTYLVSTVVLNGSCKGPIEVRVEGTLTAPTDIKSSVGVDHWITFQYVSNLAIRGGGTLNGQGASAWGKSKLVPTTLRLNFVSNGSIDHIRFLNSKNAHISLYTCDALILSNLKIRAPGDSPNTDGIKIGNSQNIQIWDSIISTGDDCISFLPNSTDVNVTRVHCGPGHGISVGSISSGTVTNLNIRNCSFLGTQNGARIKTKPQSDAGSVSGVTFEHIQMRNVNNPIFIDQQYFGSTGQEPSRIQVSDVKFTNFWGTSSSKIAIALNCSESTPCQDIELRDIKLYYQGVGGPAISICSNVKGEAFGIQKPPSCIPIRELS